MAGVVKFTFDGKEVDGRSGESLAAALVHAGIIDLRETRTGANRGIFCGMGVCQDCLVEIDGRPNQRACMTTLDAPITVRRETFGRALLPRAAGEPPKLIDSIPEEPLEILVIGAGPAGLSAAIAARRAGASVTVIDERSVAGGQYFKQVLVGGEGVADPDNQHREGAELIARALKIGVDIRCGVDIWGVFGANELIGTGAGLVRRFNPQRLIVATGAYERGVPLPGWTLPGVMTTGAAQSLWRCYRRLPGQRVLIAGNGPLNLQVASELSSGGARIAALVEIAPVSPRRALPDFLRMILASPHLVFDGLKYRASLKDVPMIYGSVVTRIETETSGLVAHVSTYPANGIGERKFTIDAVCLGYGFEPSNEILRALGCRHTFDERRGQFTAVIDDYGRTTVPNVYSVGDCTGLGGARMALAQGTVVGVAVAKDLGLVGGAESADVAAARRGLVRHRNFQNALWRLYAAPRLNLELATPETVVCRCEEVSAGRIGVALAEEASIGALKRATRAGMGSCQGRYCGAILSQVFARTQGRELNEQIRFAPRMPVKPVAIADIARWHEG
jgi:D-hydroxyproline dehydrogenase subunit alpha